MRRPLSLLAGVAAGLAVVAGLRRRMSARRERVDVYYEDGSMVSLDDGAAATERVLTLARDALHTARA